MASVVSAVLGGVPAVEDDDDSSVLIEEEELWAESFGELVVAAPLTVLFTSAIPTVAARIDKNLGIWGETGYRRKRAGRAAKANSSRLFQDVEREQMEASGHGEGMAAARGHGGIYTRR
jgi:hypothetical protein